MSTTADEGLPIECFDARTAEVGGIPVRRALPRRAHRTVGAWCFADHMGPALITRDHQFDVAPHPHIGLQTVTWLRAGSILHRDTLGSEQLIRPGQCNLMTAGHGVAHSEEQPVGARGDVHGIQLWVAQPEATRHDAPAFEHLELLPKTTIDHADATVIVGSFAGVDSSARRDTDHFGVELDLHPGRTVVPVTRAYEHAVIVLEGAVQANATAITPGHLAYAAPGREELVFDTLEPAVTMLLGGVPFPEPIEMFWNYVARTPAEIDAAVASWNDDDGRFGTVASPLARIPSPVRRAPI